MKQLILISLLLIAPSVAFAANTVDVEEPSITVCGTQNVTVSGTANADVPEDAGLRVYLNNDIVDEFSVDGTWSFTFENVPVGTHRAGIELYPLAGGNALSIDVERFTITECAPSEEPPVIIEPEPLASSGGSGGPSYRARACEMQGICTREEYDRWKILKQLLRLYKELLELRMEEHDSFNP